MPQLAIYIDNELSKELKKAIKASGKSRSKWVTDLIKAKLNNNWPEGFFKLAGSWKGEKTTDQIIATIRKNLDQTERREDLSS
jgi:hypothetical protein